MAAGNPQNYATALLDTAGRQPVRLWEELQDLQRLLDGSATLKQILADTGVSTPKDRDRVIAQVLKPFSPLARNLTALLVAERSLHRLGDIVTAYGAALKRRQGLVEVTVETPAPLTGPERTQITRSLKRKGLNPLLSERVDASLIGGLRLTVESQEYDYTIAGRIDRLQVDLLTA